MNKLPFTIILILGDSSGNKDFEYVITNYPVIDIGGYGLYGS